MVARWDTRCETHKEIMLTIQEATELVANYKGTNTPKQYGYCPTADRYHVRDRVGDGLRYDTAKFDATTHHFEVTKPVEHVTRLEMSPVTADLLAGILHRVDTGFLNDEEYQEFNNIRKDLSHATGRSN